MARRLRRAFPRLETTDPDAPEQLTFLVTCKRNGDGYQVEAVEPCRVSWGPEIAQAARLRTHADAVADGLRRFGEGMDPEKVAEAKAAIERLHRQADDLEMG